MASMVGNQLISEVQWMNGLYVARAGTNTRMCIQNQAGSIINNKVNDATDKFMA